MNQIEFNKIVKARMDKIKSTLLNKREEYAPDDEVFYNFIRGGEIARCTPTKDLWDKARKHLVSIIDIIEDTENGVYPEDSVIDEKLGDWMAYMFLLEGILKDKEQ